MVQRESPRVRATEAAQTWASSPLPASLGGDTFGAQAPFQPVQCPLPQQALRPLSSAGPRVLDSALVDPAKVISLSVCRVSPGSAQGPGEPGVRPGQMAASPCAQLHTAWGAPGPGNPPTLFPEQLVMRQCVRGPRRTHTQGPGTHAGGLPLRGSSLYLGPFSPFRGCCVERDTRRPACKDTYTSSALTRLFRGKRGAS